MISDTATLQPPFGNGLLDTIAGLVFLGPPNMDNPGIPFNLRPTAINFYTKCLVPAGSQVFATITLTKWNAALQSREEIGSAMFYSDVSISSYSLQTIPINYISADSPDTMQISFMAGNMGPGGIIIPGTEYYIDDVSLTIQNEIIDANAFFHDITVFPNPVHTSLHILSNSPGNRILTIYNSTGVRIISVNISKEQSEIEFSMFPDGMYFYNTYSENGFSLGSGKFVKE